MKYKDKGITLVALIITVIVLIIVAVITINIVFDNSILKYAKDAQVRFTRKQEEESTTLQNISKELENPTGGSINTGGNSNQIPGDTGGSSDPIPEINWTQNKTMVTNGTINLEVGDYVNYVATGSDYSGTWRVLGVENNNLLLLSTNMVIKSSQLTGSVDLIDNEGIKNLNKKCEPYGKGAHANGARCININDINRITTYNPESPGNGVIYGSKLTNQYNNEVTYTREGEYVKYSSAIKTGVSTQKNFTMPDGRNLEQSGITIKSNYYYYYPNTLSDSPTGETMGISTDSNAYKMLFRNEANTANISYWLASQGAITFDGYAQFYFRVINVGRIDRNLLYATNVSNNPSVSSPVRAVVSIETNVKLKSNGLNNWIIQD